MEEITQSSDCSLNCQDEYTPPVEIPINEYFRYHAPDTDERKAKHESINSSALALALALEAASKAMDDFAAAILSNVSDGDCLIHAIDSLGPVTDLFRHKRYLFVIQQARMLANQGITVDALRVAKLGKSDLSSQ